jgi:hypothetical protein
MERRIDSTNQDYQKLVALMNFPEPHKIPFCKEAAMLFFSNTPHKSELQKKPRLFPLNNASCTQRGQFLSESKRGSW